MAAVWDKRKGLESFIQLSEKLDDTYQIVLVGLNKEQINNLPKNIIGIEHTDSVSELVELYTSATVFVNPTLEDNYPILLPVGWGEIIDTAVEYNHRQETTQAATHPHVKDLLDREP